MNRIAKGALLTAVSLSTVLLIMFGVSRWARRPEDPILARRALRSEVLGCYALYGDNGRRVDTTYYNASPVVRLDSTVSPHVADRFAGMLRVLVSLDTLGQPDEPTSGVLPPTWRSDSLTDTIRLSFVNGFSGAEFSFAAPRGSLDTLRGRAAEHRDFGPSTTNRGAARALRIPCSPQSSTKAGWLTGVAADGGVKERAEALASLVSTARFY